jgi:hypothetical protein
MTDELRKLAGVLTDPKWERSHPLPSKDTADRFRAAASPAAVLALLDEIEHLNASNRAGIDAAAKWGAKCGELQAEVDNLMQYAKDIERKLRFTGLQRDEARAAVKRLAGTLDLALCDGRKWKDEAESDLADPVVRRIVEE